MARTRTNLAAVTAMSVLAMLAGAGCAMEETPIPALSGPSTLGQTISISITPDVLPQDGQSTARVVVQVTNASGQPVANFPLRLDMYVPSRTGLVMKDVVQLSTKFPVTGSNGLATVTYTAPAGAEEGNSPSDEIILTITATPIGSDHSAALPRSAEIRLVPQGKIS